MTMNTWNGMQKEKDPEESYAEEKTLTHSVQNDIVGSTLNFHARLVGSIRGAVSRIDQTFINE